MFSEDQRRVAIETFIRYDHSYADTVAGLGYPNRATPGLWWREYESTGEIPRGKGTRQSKHADEQMRSAVDHYLEHGRSLSRTMRDLGYPKSRQTLGDRVDELAPGRRRLRGPNPKRDPVPIEKRVRVAELEARTGPAAEIAERHGVSRTAPYAWRRETIGDDGGEPERKGEPAGKDLDDLPDDIEVPRDMLREAKPRPGRTRPGPRGAPGDPGDSEKRPGRRPRLPGQRGEGGDGGGAGAQA